MPFYDRTDYTCQTPDDTIHLVSLSGGKDSTAMLLLMLEKGMRVDRIVFFDTGIEFPAMYDHLNALQERTGVEIDWLCSDRPFFFMMSDKDVQSRTYGHRHGYGWPTHQRRWCTREKLAVIHRYKKQLAASGKRIIEYIGIAADEPKRILDDPNKRYPLHQWGITENVALQICLKRGYDFGGLYNHFDRVSCWCCPLGGIKRAQILHDHFPELWAKLKLWDDMHHDDWTVSTDYIERHSISSLEERFHHQPA